MFTDLGQNYPLLELKKVRRTFGYDAPVHALADIDLRLASGEWLAITGPSGAGKSTLLNIIGCLDQPTSGHYFFDGVDTTTLSDSERAGLRARRIGFVFQSFHLLAHRSAVENVMLAEVYRHQFHHGRRGRALEVLTQVGLRARADYAPTKLSGGEQQRVAIARALLGSPSLLLCDEPTGNLDSASAARILDLLQALNRQGLTLIVVTHDENVARRASRRIEIIDGKVAKLTGQATRLGSAGGRDGGARRQDRIARSGLTFHDLLEETIASLFAKPVRTALTGLGIVVGIAALVATVGISRTAGNRIIGTFNALAATEVVITPRASLASLHNRVLPWDAGARLERLNGVVAAGTLTPVPLKDTLVSTSPIKDPRRQTAFKLAVQAASPPALAAVRAQLKHGRLFDEGHSQRANRVALLGPAAADRLGIVGLKHLPAIAIGDKVYLVMGILNSVGRQSDLLSSVIIPEGTARHDFGLPSPGAVIVETNIGAATLIARQAPLAIRPDDPKALKVASPPEPKRVREAIQSNLNVLLLLLGGLSLVVGAIGIGNITLVSVMERIGEIGLRRALGATHRHIALQFLLESTAIGIMGGMIGTSLGILLVVAIAAYQAWTPVIDPVVPLLAPLVGGLVGLISGTYPARRAANLEPVEALRGR